MKGLDTRLNGFTFKIFWSDEDKCFLGKVDKFESLGSHGDTPEEALKEIIRVTLFVLDELESVDDPILEGQSNGAYGS